MEDTRPPLAHLLHCRRSRRQSKVAVLRTGERTLETGDELTMSRESVTAVTVDGRCRSRVIMYTPEPAGGMAYYVSELVVALAQAGVRVVLLAPANFQHNAKVCAAGAELVHAPCRKTSKAGLSERLLRNVRFAAET